MNQLTRCGLLPSVPECLPYEIPEKKLPVHFGDNIVVPAPFAFRPFSQYYNPYSRGCSILCNHPVDEETKQQASHHHSKSLSERKYRIVIDDDIESSGNWQNDIFVPEALFRRYTETDSRPPSPNATSTITNATHKLIATQSRRCLTPDPSIHVPEKTQLILDLRKTASQVALNDNSLYSDNSFLTSWPVNSKNKNETSRKTNEICSNKSTLKSLPVDKSKTSNQIARYTEPTKLNTSQLGNDKTSSPVVRALQEKKKKPVKRLKSKKKYSKRNSSAKNEVGNNLNDPNETQISTLDDGNAVTANNVTPAAIDEETVNGNVHEDEVEPESNFDPTSYVEEHLLKRLRKEFNYEVLNYEMDEKHSKIFEEMMSKLASVFPLSRPSDTTDVENEIRKLQREFRLNSVVPTIDSLPNVAGVFSRRNVRFELPMDRMTLEGMTPFDYLKNYVHITKSRLWVYNRVFEMHANGEEFMKVHKLFPALQGVIERELTQEEKNLCCNLFAALKSTEIHFDFQTWCGICAFCERIFCAGNTHDNFQDDSRHEVEMADFEYLDRKIRNLKISQQLKTILCMIRAS